MELTGALLIVGGFVAGVVALCGMLQFGPRRILGSALCGLIINGLLISIGVSNFFAARNRAMESRRALSELHETKLGIAKEMVAEDGTTNRGQSLSRMVQALEKANKNLEGDEAKVMQAMAAYSRQMMSLSEALYASGYDPVAMIEFSTLKERTELARRKKITADYIAANDALQGFLRGTETYLENELERQKLSSAKIQQIMRPIRLNFRDKTAVALELQEACGQNARAVRDMLDILESNWGHWRCEGPKEQIEIESAEATAKYGEECNRFQESADAIEELEEKRLQLLKKAQQE